MQPRQNTRGIAAIGLVLAIVALIMNDLPAMIAAATIGLFLIYRAFIFTAGCRRFLTSVAITREADRHVVRQGAVVSVTSRIDARRPDQVEVTLRDIFPALAVSGNETTGPAYLPSLAGGWTIGYPIRFMAAGETRFGGVAVTLTDPFYCHEVRCTALNCKEPAVRVLPPHAATAPEGSSFGDWQRDHDYLHVVKGQIVRSFRPYRPGDDPRDIDRKMSAKHDRLFAREMSGQGDAMPFIIADLPDLQASVDAITWTEFSAAVSGAVWKAIRGPGGCSLTIISGADVIDSFTPIQVLRRAPTLIDTLQQVDRHTHLYRMRNRTSLRATAGQLERLQRRSKEEPCRYRENLLRLYRILPEQITATPFEVQIRRALGASDSDSVYLYTCRNGDASHIGCIAREAAKKRMQLRLWAPGRTACPRPRPGQGQRDNISPEEAS